MTSQAPAHAGAPDGRALLEPFAGLCLRAEPVPRAVTAEVRQSAERVLELAPEELYALMTPALCGKYVHLGLQWLYDAGLLIHLVPELEATVEFSQEAGRRHKDVWDHTKTVVWQSVPRPEVRWASLLHDIGKVPTRRFLPGGKVSFLGHAEEGVRMFRRGPKVRIGFPPDVEERVEALILYHLRPGQYDGYWTDSAVRRFARDVGPHLRDLMDLSRADVTSRRPGKRKRCLALISELARRIAALDAEDHAPKPLPPGLGTALMTELELPPGKHLAVLRDRLAELCSRGELQGGEPFDYYVDAVRRLDLLQGIEIRAARRG